MKTKTNYQSGQALIIATVLFTLISAAVIGSFLAPIVRTTRTTQDFNAGDSSYIVADSGVEDVVYRLINSVPVSSSETLSLDGNTVTTNITTTAEGKTITSNGDWQNRLRKLEINLAISSGASFNLGMQVGAGGFTVDSNTDLYGNLYSNGTIRSTSNFEIFGDAVSAGPSGLIFDAHVTGNAYAHSINNSNIDGDAYYYTNKTGTTVDGVSHPNSPDQPILPLPITEETIDSWETQAAAYVTNCSGTLNLSGTITIGPRKYTCNVTINSNATITLAGPIWVVGNFTNNSNLNINVSSTQSGKTIPIIADNPTNRTTSSKIINGGNLDVNGYGDNSYVMFLSRNNSAELGGTQEAIINNSNMNSQGGGDAILYAGHGMIKINSNTDVNQLTGYKVDVNSNFNLIYRLGLADLIFTSGPGGSWNITNWLETP
jgi:hypothetical protein